MNCHRYPSSKGSSEVLTSSKSPLLTSLNPCITLATPQTSPAERYFTLCCRSEMDTGNGIETAVSFKLSAPESSIGRNNGDTGNGIKTLRTEASRQAD